MTAVKTDTITFRIRPEIKAALRQAAEHQHRSLANMLEVMILDWCGQPPAPSVPERDQATLGR